MRSENDNTSESEINIRSPSGAARIYVAKKLEDDGQKIRLFHLEPGSGSSHLRGTLHLDTPTPSTPYEALSYTWGDASNTRKIILDGYLVDVTFNLYSALLRLRRENSTRVVWIDAICIDQANVNERTQQVQLMGQIYSMCDQVVVWIGDSPFDTVPVSWTGDDAKDGNLLNDFWDDFYYFATEAPDEDGIFKFDWTFHAFGNLRLLSSGHLSDQPLFQDMTDSEFAYPVPFQDYCANIREALRGFIYSPWWTRIWTVQEIVLPHRATFLYGPVSVGLPVLLEGFNECMKHMLDACCGHTYSHAHSVVRGLITRMGAAVKNISNLRQARSEMDKIELWETLVTVSSRDSTDDRDRIFGVLGLVNKWYDKPLVVDYACTPMDVYTQVAVATALGKNSLLPLHYPLQKNSYPGLPSWVIDWTAPTRSPLSRTHRGRWIDPRFQVFPNAGKDRCHIRTHLDNRILEVKARRCDRVAIVGQACIDEVNKRRQAYCDWFTLAGLDKDPKRPYRSGGSWFDAFWRCLCWDQVYNRLERENDQDFWGYSRCGKEVPYEDCYDRFIDFCCRSTTSPFHPKGLPQASRAAIVELEPRLNGIEEALWGEYSSAVIAQRALVHSGTTDMAIFTTDLGYLGVGPADTMVGDEVWCLLGGWMPFVLRLTETAQEMAPGKGKKPLHNVLGISYVHGVMDGEVSDNIEIPQQYLFLA